MPKKRIAALAIAAQLAAASFTVLPAQSLASLFKAAAAANQDYAMAKVDLDLAELRRVKGEVEARVELDRVIGQSTFVSAQGKYLAAIATYFNEVVDAVFNAAKTELDADIASLTLENSREDRKYAELRYKNGLISEEDFKKADLAFRTNEAAQETAALTAQDAKDAILQSLGLEWKNGLIPEAPAFSPQGTREDWVGLDVPYRTAILADKAAQLKTAALPGNAAPFDRKIQETENLKAKASLDGSKTDAQRAYDGILRLLKNQKSALQVRSDDRDLKTATYEDALRRYKSGAISLTEMNTARIAELSSRRLRFEAQQNYLKTIGKYLLYMGQDPTGL
jgi:outer membrane protein TolC